MDTDFTKASSNSILSVGDSVEVFWPLENSFYPGQVTSIYNEKFHIYYHDGYTEDLNLSSHIFRHVTDSFVARSAKLIELASTEQDDIPNMFHFRQ